MSHSPEADRIEWLVKPWIARKSINLFCAPAGTGKTHMLWQLLDRYRAEIGSVLVCNVDRQARWSTSKFKKLGTKQRWPVVSLAETGITTEWVKDTAKPDPARIFRWLCHQVEEHRPDFVWVEPGPAVVPCASINSHVSVTQGFNILRAWVESQALTLGLSWHTRKDTTGIRPADIRELVAGSNNIPGLVETVAVALREKEEPSQVVVHLTSPEAPETELLLERRSDAFFSIVEDVAGSSHPTLLAAIEAQGSTAFELQLTLGVSKATIHRRLDKLIEEGFVRRREGRYFRSVS